MTTTIEVQEETLELLKEYKKQFKAKDFDHIISGLVQIWLEGRKLKGCLKPYLPKGITREEILKDLRDETDRY